MLLLLKNKINMFFVWIIRHSSYYKDLNEVFHELWYHNKINTNIDYTRIKKYSLYAKCLQAEIKHKRI